MNRLKYAFGINVPHTVLSHMHERRYSDVRLLRLSRCNAFRPKRFSDVRNVDNGRQQRVRSGGTQQRRQKSSTVWIKKPSEDTNFLTKDLQNRCKSSYQIKRMNNEQCFGKQLRKSIDCFKDAKSTKTNTTEPEPGSYAHIIATYSEAMYSKSAFVTLKDSTGYGMINRTHRSPFSTASMISMKPFHAASPSLLNQEANFSTETSVTRSDFQNPRSHFIETSGGSETDTLKRVSSYATIIERYSNTVSLNVDTRGWRNCMVPRRYVSTKFDNLPLMFKSTESSAASPKEIVEFSNQSITGGLTEVRAGDESKEREDRQASYIIKDPERSTAMNDYTDANLHVADEQADWLGRVVSAHKNSIRDGKLACEGMPEKTNENVAYEMSTHTELEEDHPLTEMSANKPSNPISDYIKRGPVSSNTQGGAGQAPTKSSSQSSATVSTPAREPQIELRMTPSHNESVVAINVDEVSTRTAGAKDHLSVVISSRKNTTNSADRANMDARSDFGSMQISISEDTVPVKQIEFSINGKPVSELKSIVARADKLDVLSSMDKVEIRIPSKDNYARMTNQQTQQAARATSNPSAILNLHINAKFNEPRVLQPKDAGVKPESIPPVSRSTPPGQVPVPPKTRNIFSPTSQENTKLDSTTVSNMERPKEHSKDPQVNTGAFATASKETFSNVAQNVDKGLSQNINSGANQPPKNSPQNRTINIQNPRRDNPVENREPSNMIPWWSSEEAFKKIKKKGCGLGESSPVEAEPNKIKGIVEPKRPETILKTESTSQPQSAVSSNPSQSPKAITLEKEAKKSDVPEKLSELLNFSAVRVTSPQRFVPGKTAKSVKQKNRVTKKVHRARNVVKMSTFPKQSSDTPINPVPPPKIVKFVAVNPRTVEVDRRPEVTSTDEKQRTKVVQEIKRFEGNAARVGHENVQKNSDTVIKGADLGRPANRSAGVSANSASAVGESGSVPTKRKAQDEMSNTVKKASSGERVFDRKMTEILKTMKPIEKRKDGTLIDYGVTVPSRKPSESKLGHRSKSVHPVLSARSTKNIVDQPDRVEPEKATKEGGSGKIENVPKKKMSSKVGKDASNQLKIGKGEKPVGKEFVRSKSATSPAEVIVPVKISLVKKETPTKPKVVTSQTKIVEPVKISSVKKVTALEDDGVSPSSQSKSDGLDRISLTKKQTHQGPKNIPYVPRLDSEHTFPTKQILHTNRESEKLGDSQAKVSVKKIGNEKKSVDTVNALAILNSKKLSDGKAKVQNTSDSTKSLKPKDSSKSIRESSDKKETRTILLKGSEARSGGTMSYNPQFVAKKSRTQSCPPKPRPIDRKSEKVSLEKLDKRFKETGIAPFKGTIKHRPLKSNSAHFSNTSEEKKATSKKYKTETGGGSSGIGNPTVGPAGLKSSRTFVMDTTISIDNVTTEPVASSLEKESKLHEEKKSDKMITEQQCRRYLVTNESERPEKGLLYASWLQRFKNSVDDDKIL